MTVGKWQLPKLDTDLLVAPDCRCLTGASAGIWRSVLAATARYSVLSVLRHFLLAQLSGLASQGAGRNRRV